MWLDKLFSTVSYFDKPVTCAKHDPNKLKNKKSLKLSDEAVKKSEEIFCVLVYIRKCVMNPFYYNTPYPPAISGSWFKQMENLPWDSALRPEQLEQEVGIVQLIHDIATYTLASLTKVCIFCENTSLSTWVNNTKEDTDLWHSLKLEPVDFKEVIRSSQYQKILDNMYEHDFLSSNEYEFIETIFSATFMIRYSIFSTESVESIISINKNMIEHTKKFTLKFPIGDDQPEHFENLSESANNLKGNEKEMFKTLLDLVTRAVKFLKHKKYKEAETFSHAIVTLIPSWCEGYFCLAFAAYQCENSHCAHIYASQGQQNCYDKACSKCKSVQPQIDLWKKECGSICDKEDAIVFVSEDEEEEEEESSSMTTKQEMEACKADDVPELTDPSSSDESHYESQSDSDGPDLPSSPSFYDSLSDPDPEDKQQPLEETSINSNAVVDTDQGQKPQSPIDKNAVVDTDQGQKPQSPIDKEVLEQRAFLVSKVVRYAEMMLALDMESLEERENVETEPDVSEQSVTTVSEVMPGVSGVIPSYKKNCELKRHKFSRVPQQPGFRTSQEKPKNNAKKTEKAKSKKQQPSEVKEAKQDVEKDLEKQQHFKNVLKEGYLALMNECGLAAAQNFNDALSELNSNPDFHKLKEYEMVCLKYAYGTACWKAGTLDHLNKAITTFNDILNNHKNTWFPVSYYGLGNAQLKLNKFKEALSHFEMLQSMVDKGIRFSVYCWPGTGNPIKETKIEELKKLLSDMITKCRNPPAPAATCRYKNCVSKPDIYYSDPDFKGFAALQCQDRCILNYHPVCWRALKDILNRTDKDFLGQQCLTPDCEYIVMEIKCIGKDGNLEKHFEIEDPEKVKKQKKSRLEKKLVIKEQKKRRRRESQSTQISESSEVCDNNDESVSECTSNTSDIALNKREENYEAVQNGGAKKVDSNLSVNAKPFYSRKDSSESTKDSAKALYRLQKDTKEAESVTENLKVSKPKEKKKTSKPAAISLEEFRQQSEEFSLYDEYQARLHDLQQNANVEDLQTHWSTICATENIPQFDPDRPFYIPEKLREDHLALEAVLLSYSNTERGYLSKFLKGRVYMHLEKLLNACGPLRVDDPLLLEEVKKFPESYRKIIGEAGSLINFVQACMKFALVGEYICLIADVLKAYSLNSNSFSSKGYSTDSDTVQEHNELMNDSLNEDECQGKSNDKVHSQLNPHAVAYNPVSPVASRGSISPENSSNSLETCQSDVSVKETEQESPTKLKSTVVSSLNILRSPLQSNGQSFGDQKIPKSDISDEHVHKAISKDKSGYTEDVKTCHSEPLTAFMMLEEEIQELPQEKMSSVFLEILKFLLSNEYFVENVAAFNQRLKPLSFSLASKSTANKCLQAGSAEVEMPSKAVMKEDEQMKAVIESFRNLDRYRNNINESKKILEQQLEHAMDTIAQLQNTLSVTDKSTQKKVEEVQALLEEERKESKRKEKEWEKEQKNYALNCSKISDMLRISRDKIKSSKEQISRKTFELKEAEELKKATELDLARESQAKADVEASFNTALEFHETKVLSLTRKLQNAQLEILHLKKKNVLEKLNVATRNSELRLKEIQDGMPLVTHPIYLDQMKALQTQIKEHICQLAKICTEFVKAVDEQIKELKEGKDLHDMKPIVEPTLSECPTLKAPSTVFLHSNKRVALSTYKQIVPFWEPLQREFATLSQLTRTAVQGASNLAEGSSILQAPLMPQTPSSSSVQSTSQIYSQFLTAQNQKLTTSPSPSPHGAVSSFQGLGASTLQMPNMINSPRLFDSPFYTTATAGFLQKPAASFQPNGPRAHVPPGLNFYPYTPTSQVLSSSLSQSSSVFHTPQVTTQNIPVTQPMQTPFSFGFPQLPSKIVTALPNTSENTIPEPIAELASLNSAKKVGKECENKSPLGSETHSEKSVSRDSISEVKSTTSNSALSDSFLPPGEKKNLGNSSNSSPVPVQPSAERLNHASSSHSIPMPVSDHPVVNKASASVNDLESTGVKPKQPVTNAKQKKITGISCSGTSSVASDCDTSSQLELGYTVKETRDAPGSNIPQPSSSTNGFVKPQKPAAQGKNVPSTNSYEKLISKLMTSYPQYTREILIECVVEFRKNNNNKLSNLKFGSIISGIGAILKRRKSVVPQAGHKKKPQLHVLSLTKKPAPPPPPPEKSGICPWAIPELQSTSTTAWHGDNADTLCSICLEEMTARSSVKKLECGHRFHMPCLKEWLRKNSNCPICRVHVLLPEDYPSLK